VAAADSGIWELPGSEQFTQSKIACWSALQRAVDLAGKGHVPDREAERWRRTIDAIEDLVDRECWSEERQAYTQCPGSDKLGRRRAPLLATRPRRREPRPPGRDRRRDPRRARPGTVVYRYSSREREEGAFVSCSFRLGEALARLGRVDEAEGLSHLSLIRAAVAVDEQRRSADG
jgi:GH15 family glucan-1,4-alpha-glucosidase